MVRAKLPKRRKIIYIVLLMIALVVIAGGVVWYTQYQKSSGAKIKTMETAFNQGQGVVSETLRNYVQVDDAFFSRTTKECDVSGNGYPGDTNYLDCSISNNNFAGGYIKADTLSNAQLASLMREVDSKLKSKGFKTTASVDDSISQYSIVATRDPNCEVYLDYSKPMSGVPNSYGPQWAATTSSLLYQLHCHVPVTPVQPGSFQISCSDKYKNQVPAGYTCE